MLVFILVSTGLIAGYMYAKSRFAKEQKVEQPLLFSNDIMIPLENGLSTSRLRVPIAVVPKDIAEKIKILVKNDNSGAWKDAIGRLLTIRHTRDSSLSVIFPPFSLPPNTDITDGVTVECIGPCGSTFRHIVDHEELCRYGFGWWSPAIEKLLEKMGALPEPLSPTE
jgi:hypothetical protein